MSNSIIQKSEIQAYGFSESSPSTVVFSFSGFGGAQFELYDPAGNKLFTRSPATATNILLSVVGAYTLLVHDDDYAATGNYSFSATCIGGCSLTINPTTGTSVVATATSGIVSVTTCPGTNWTATVNASWLSITSATNGSGLGSVSYAVAANDSLVARVGTMTIAGLTFTVNQAAAFNVSGQPIGNPGTAGGFSYSNGVFTLTGSGEDIEGTADDFYFVHQLMSGDGQITARMLSLQASDSAAEIGVMIRETVDAGSKHAFERSTASTNIVFRRRLATDDYNIDTVFTGTNSAWLRLMRMGNTFIGLSSTNGLNWRYVWFSTVNMSNTVQVGLAITAHHLNQYATGRVDNVTIGNLTPIPGAWPDTGIRLHLGGEPSAYPPLQSLGGFRMLAAGAVGDQFSVRYTTNVTLPFASWLPLGNITNQFGVTVFTDPQALTNPLRYYHLQKVGP